MKLYKYFILLVLFSCSNDIQIKEINNWSVKHNNDYIPATVPGNIFIDLLSNKIIPDPFMLNNEDSVQWVHEKIWEYSSFFNVSNKILKQDEQMIKLKGLDTYATVYLNDSLILEADNMFRSWEVSVKNILKPKNELKIIFKPTNKIETKKIELLGYELPGGSRVHTRKAGFHYGWDWGPKLSPTGIWRPIKLIAYSNIKIQDVYVKQKKLSDSLAKIDINIELNVKKKGEYHIKINNQRYDLKLDKGIKNISLNHEIKDPLLWWPNGYGDQHMYNVKISVFKNRKIDEKNIKIGLRTIELVNEKDSLGESFYFKINNKPIFIKGANYIPQDNFQNRVDKTKYHNLLTDVKESNMNMLRVWGGGIYEEDIFYNICDSLGILIWQDFMFACAMYPSDSSFIDNLKKEATYNVKRLRNHPSIILWCGNNEVSEGWHRWGWQDNYSINKRNEIWDGYKLIFRDILPDIIQQYTSLPYWESSPKFGRGNPKHQFEGDSHYWGVWHDKEPFTNFEKKVPRFMSEFGFQSFPSISTIASFAEESSWNLNSTVMQAHQKHPRGNMLILEYMQKEYNVPKDFKKFIYASQILQANGIRVGIEAHRRNQPYCMGTLYWQLNDCWPAASWSSRDYYGNWKALQYSVKKSFNPILISLVKKRETDAINIWIISDHEKFNDTLIVNTYKLNGRLVSSKENNIMINTGSQQLLNNNFTCNDDEFIIAHLKNKKIKSEVYFKNSVKEYEFLKPNFTYHIKNDYLYIKSDIPAFKVFLQQHNNEFNDNFFTLLPKEEKKIQITNVEHKENNLLIWSLYDLNKEDEK